VAYGEAVPGRLIRASVGDELAVTVKNRLDHSTSVHWHGIALRNDMDGAAPASPDIEAGTDFVYRFSVPHPGTYWAHPHTGLDLDTGLYLPIVVDDPAEPGAYDAEWIVVLDDWTDGIGSTPQQIYDGLRGSSMHGMPGMGEMPHVGEMPGMGGAGNRGLLGGDAGDVEYPYYLVNGRVPAAPTTFTARPGQRVRIRIINAGCAVPYRGMSPKSDDSTRRRHRRDRGSAPSRLVNVLANTVGADPGVWAIGSGASRRAKVDRCWIAW
jgi:multicopper oxidase